MIIIPHTGDQQCPRTNMQVQSEGDICIGQFAQNLLKLGNGKKHRDKNRFILLESMGDVEESDSMPA